MNAYKSFSQQYRFAANWRQGDMVRSSKCTMTNFNIAALPGTTMNIKFQLQCAGIIGSHHALIYLGGTLCAAKPVLPAVRDTDSCILRLLMHISVLLW